MSAPVYLLTFPLRCKAVFETHWEGEPVSLVSLSLQPLLWLSTEVLSACACCQPLGLVPTGLAWPAWAGASLLGGCDQLLPSPSL